MSTSIPNPLSTSVDAWASPAPGAREHDRGDQQPSGDAHLQTSVDHLVKGQRPGRGPGRGHAARGRADPRAQQQSQRRLHPGDAPADPRPALPPAFDAVFRAFVSVEDATRHANGARVFRDQTKAVYRSIWNSFVRWLVADRSKRQVLASPSDITLEELKGFLATVSTNRGPALGGTRGEATKETQARYSKVVRRVLATGLKETPDWVLMDKGRLVQRYAARARLLRPDQYARALKAIPEVEEASERVLLILMALAGATLRETVWIRTNDIVPLQASESGGCQVAVTIVPELRGFRDRRTVHITIDWAARELLAHKARREADPNGLTQPTPRELGDDEEFQEFLLARAQHPHFLAGVYGRRLRSATGNGLIVERFLTKVFPEDREGKQLPDKGTSLLRGACIAAWVSAEGVCESVALRAGIKIEELHRYANPTPTPGH